MYLSAAPTAALVVPIGSGGLVPSPGGPGPSGPGGAPAMPGGTLNLGGLFTGGFAQGAISAGKAAFAVAGAAGLTANPIGFAAGIALAALGAVSYVVGLIVRAVTGQEEAPVIQPEEGAFASPPHDPFSKMTDEEAQALSDARQASQGEHGGGGSAPDGGGPMDPGADTSQGGTQAGPAAVGGSPDAPAADSDSGRAPDADHGDPSGAGLHRYPGGLGRYQGRPWA